MNIYTSEKVVPYVYMCIHKETNQFYIGSRVSKSMKLPPHLDLQTYKTSSRIVKPNFHMFECVIIAEFMHGADAYDFEQELIYNHWGDPLLLNKRCHCGQPRWSTAGSSVEFTEERRKNISNSLKGRKLSEETKQKLREINLGKKQDPEVSRRISEHHKQNLHSGNFKPGHRPWNTGLAGTGLIKRSEEFKQKLRNIKRSEEFKENLRKPKVFYDIISPDGFIFERMSLGEVISMFNFRYNSVKGTLWKGESCYRNFTFFRLS